MVRDLTLIHKPVRSPPLDPKERQLYSAIQWHEDDYFEIFEPGVEPTVEAVNGTYYAIIRNTSHMYFRNAAQTGFFESMIATTMKYILGGDFVLAPKSSKAIARADQLLQKKKLQTVVKLRNKSIKSHMDV